MELLTFTMTGTAHSAAYKQNKDDITECDLLDLEWDEHNQYDTEAIKVLLEGEHIGWVPKKLGEAKTMLRKLMALEGFVMQAVVAQHDVDNPTDMQLQVSVEVHV